MRGWHARVFNTDRPKTLSGSLRDPRASVHESASGVFGPWRDVEQCPVLVALEERIEALHEPVVRRGVGL